MAFKLTASFVAALLSSLPVINAAAVVSKGVTCPTGQTTAYAACCAFFPLLEDLQGEDLLAGDCGDAAHSILRMAFHDAIGFSKSGQGGGGADGSLVVFNATELVFAPNDGLDDALDIFSDNILEHPEISPGDYIQFATAVSLTNCPGAPRIQFLAGRPQPKASSPAPNGLVPEPFDSVTSILQRMGDAGFSPAETIALLSSHSIAGADTVDPSIPGSPFDTTHDVYDTQVFIEVLLKGTLFPGNQTGQGEVQSPVAGVIRLQSDHDLARDPRTDCIWQSFANDHALMASRFQAAMQKLAVLGQNPSSLIDCSDVIPQAKPLRDIAHFPPTLTNKDIEQACAFSPFPTLPTLPGPATTIPPIPQGGGGGSKRRA